jgi:hypothetical protein
MTVFRKSAISFILCRAFVEEIVSLQRNDGSDEEKGILLTNYREYEAVLGRGTQIELSEGTGPLFWPLEVMSSSVSIAGILHEVT